MLKRLGRLLRAAGYDMAIADGGTRDAELLAWAQGESRLMIARDRKLAEHRDARGHLVVLRANNLRACVAEPRERLGVDWLLQALQPPDLLAGRPNELTAHQNQPRSMASRLSVWRED